MSSTATPLPIRLLDSFLQERNIRWLLAAGAMILLASSLMLITSHWGDYTPTWQYLIMLAYTGLIHVAAGWTGSRLGLRRTSIALRALTLLLLPVLFLALQWLQAGGAWPMVLALLGLTTGLSIPVARQHFGVLLQGVPASYLCCYVLLALAGALLPVVPEPLALPAVGLLWGLVGVGTVKINRHVFWLDEAAREPRIFAFFPATVLIGQFLALVWLHFGDVFSLQWLGFGFALLAIPVLATADAVGRVHRLRNGGLIRRQPVIVALPLLVGLGFCSLALSLAAAAPVAGELPLALSPTALLVAGMLGLAAWRTEQPLLVWASLLALTVAYAFAPLWVSETWVPETWLPEVLRPGPVRSVSGYLPLVIGLLLAARRWPETVFGTPLQYYGAAGLLLLSGVVVAAVVAGQLSWPFSRWLLLDEPWWSMVLLAGLLLVYGRMLARSHGGLFWLCAYALAFAYLTVGLLALWLGLAEDQLLLALVLMAVTHWALSLRGYPEAIYAPVGECLTRWALIGFVLAFVLPLTVLEFMLAWDLLPGTLELARLAGLLWLFALCRQQDSIWPALLGYAGLWLLAGVELQLRTNLDGHWLLLLWTVMALPLLVLRCGGALERATRGFALTVLVLQALLAVVLYSPAVLVGGLIAGAALYWQGYPVRRDQVLALLSWQLLGQGTALVVGAGSFGELWHAAALPGMPLLALLGALVHLAWLQAGTSRLAEGQRLALLAVTVLALAATLDLGVLTPLQLGSVIGALLLLAGAELQTARREQLELRVWTALALLAGVPGVLWWQGLVRIGSDWGPWLLLGTAAVAALLARFAGRDEQLAVFVRPLAQLALALPLAAVAATLYRHFGSVTPVLGSDGLPLLLAAAAYAAYGHVYGRKQPLLLALVLVNLVLVLLWRELGWYDPQLYLIPLGLSLLALRWLLAAELPESFHQPLAYLGALTILVSPLFHIVTGSWLHIFTLMLSAVLVMLLGIGLRVRALLYTGGGFLLADLIAMVVRGGIDHPGLLWVAGLLLGALVLGLGAVAEQHREQLLGRLRRLAANLSTWS